MCHDPKQTEYEICMSRVEVAGGIYVKTSGGIKMFAFTDRYDGKI